MRRISVACIGLIMILSLALSACGTPAAVQETSTAPFATSVSTMAPTEAPTVAPTVTKPARPDLILATTTSTQDSGLLDVLIPDFEAHTGYVVQTVAVGTGAALKLGQEGNADVLLVHAPASEVTFMQGGFGSDRRLVMHNDFIIVGPTDDPAGIKNATSAIDAFKKIAAAEAKFDSRGDASGTNKAEQTLWKSAAIDPTGKSWYVETGQGMGATLTIASETNAYTLTDRATYLANKASLNLDLLYQGDNALLNVYHVIIVNHDKWPGSNLAGATAFADYIVSAEAQALIGSFGVQKYGQQLFIPDAGKTDASLGLP
jgi:tungstate transport system substrate-binding protein